MSILIRLNLLTSRKFQITDTLLDDKKIIQALLKINEKYFVNEFVMFFLLTSARKRFYIYFRTNNNMNYFSKIVFSKRDYDKMIKEKKIIDSIKNLDISFSCAILDSQLINKKFLINTYHLIQKKWTSVSSWSIDLENIWKELTHIHSIGAEDAINYVWYDKLIKSNIIDITDLGKVKTSFIHGDFVPWNIYHYYNKEYLLIDFEYAYNYGPILYDPIHFILADYFYLRRKKINWSFLLEFAKTLYSNDDLQMQIISALIYEVNAPNCVNKKLVINILVDCVNYFSIENFHYNEVLI
jgi:hypothetical protein